MIRCRAGELYTGIATDVRRRLREHELGARRGAKYLRGRGPLEVVFAQRVGDRGEATRIELRIKALTKLEKESLVAGDARLSARLGLRRAWKTFAGLSGQSTRLSLARKK